MLTLSKKTDYALISLAFLAGHGGGLASARQIASAADLPLALLMQILKTLHQHGLLRSTRGVKGGYTLAAEAEKISLLRLIRIVDGEPASIGSDSMSEGHPPLVAMHRKLMQFLDEVMVFDVIRPGRRIDVPVESVGFLDRIKGPVRLGRPVLATTGSAGLI